MTVIAITGGRDYFPPYGELLEMWDYVLGHTLASPGEVELIHGTASGVDSFVAGAIRWAYAEGELKITAYPADWARYGKNAGGFRNQQMIDVADVLYAFKGGRGTADCIARAEKKGIPVHRIGAANA